MKTEADKNNDGKDDITGAEVKRKGAFAQGFAKGYSKTFSAHSVVSNINN